MDTFEYGLNLVACHRDGRGIDRTAAKIRKVDVNTAYPNVHDLAVRYGDLVRVYDVDQDTVLADAVGDDPVYQDVSKWVAAAIGRDDHSRTRKAIKLEGGASAEERKVYVTSGVVEDSEAVACAAAEDDATFPCVDR